MMNYLLPFFFGIICLVAQISAQAAPQSTSFVAVMTPTVNHTVTGTAVFTPLANGTVRVDYNFTGFSPNTTHGVHVHEFGDISDADGTSAGGHFNPLGTPHGCFPDHVRHAGDLGNVTADDQGTATGFFLNELLSTIPSSPTYFGGRGLIIHALPDFCVQPTGGAGARFSRGVIGFAAGATPSNITADEKGDNSTYLHAHFKNGHVRFYLLTSGIVVGTFSFLDLKPNSTYTFAVSQNGDLRSSFGSTLNPSGTIGVGCPPFPVSYTPGSLGTFNTDSLGNIQFARIFPSLSVAANSPYSLRGRSVYLFEGSDNCANALPALDSAVIGVAAYPAGLDASTMPANFANDFFSTQPPATQPPATQPPATQPPATQPPATLPPATQPPATQPPATQPPATLPPSTQPPATLPPSTQPPSTTPPTTLPPSTCTSQGTVININFAGILSSSR